MGGNKFSILVLFFAAIFFKATLFFLSLKV